MIKQRCLPIFLILVSVALRAQTVSISEDGQKMSFTITNTTAKNTIDEAVEVFAAHNVAVGVKASRKSGIITKLTIQVNASKGLTNYESDDTEVLKKGVTILVDRSPDAAVEVCVGTCGGIDK